MNSQEPHVKSSGIIIGENQLVAISKRAILHTLSIMRNTVDLSNTLDKPLQLSLYTLSRLLIVLTGISFSLGSQFIYFIQNAYTNIQSKIKINGLLSDTFTVIQGFRHGCPL